MGKGLGETVCVVLMWLILLWPGIRASELGGLFLADSPGVLEVVFMKVVSGNLQLHILWYNSVPVPWPSSFPHLQGHFAQGEALLCL